jgi:hypothetical protein
MFQPTFHYNHPCVVILDAGQNAGIVYNIVHTPPFATVDQDWFVVHCGPSRDVIRDVVVALKCPDPELAVMEFRRCLRT